MITKWPAAAQHFMVIVLVGVLTLLQQNIAVLNDSIPTELQPVVAAAITFLLTCLTPLTTAYGVGAGEAADVVKGVIGVPATTPKVSPPQAASTPAAAASDDTLAPFAGVDGN